MTAKDIRRDFRLQVERFLSHLRESAEEALEETLAERIDPTRCASINLHSVRWDNGEAVTLCLYVERHNGDEVIVDGER